MDTKQIEIDKDKERILALGGPAKVAEILKFDKRIGCQRVQNWMTRGIPSRVKLDNPELFLIEQAA